MIGAFIAWGDRKDSPGWIIAENGCHIWAGSKTRCGHGRAWVRDDVHGHWIGYIHRIRYEREVGPVPEGMELDHFVCSNPACCNPRHVRPVTHRENVLRGDSPAAWHAGKTHCPHGHEYTADNLERSYLRLGRRRCLTCARAQKKASRARLRAAR